MNICSHIHVYNIWTSVHICICSSMHFSHGWIHEQLFICFSSERMFTWTHIHITDVWTYEHIFIWKIRCVKFDCIQYSCTTTTSKNYIKNFRCQLIMITFVNNTLKTFDIQRYTPQIDKFTAYVCIQKTSAVFSFRQ